MVDFDPIQEVRPNVGVNTLLKVDILSCEYGIYVMVLVFLTRYGTGNLPKKADHCLYWITTKVTS